jgi:hypothetical protein
MVEANVTQFKELARGVSASIRPVHCVTLRSWTHRPRATFPTVINTIDITKRLSRLQKWPLIALLIFLLPYNFTDILPWCEIRFACCYISDTPVWAINVSDLHTWRVFAQVLHPKNFPIKSEDTGLYEWILHLYALRFSRRSVFRRCVLRLLVTAKVVPSSPIHSTLMIDTIRFSETSILTTVTRCNILEDGIIQTLTYLTTLY